MGPFCIKHHNNVHPDVSIASFKINTWKALITPNLLSLYMIIKNEFDHHKIGNEFFLIASFWSPYSILIMIQWSRILRWQFYYQQFGDRNSFSVIKNCYFQLFVIEFLVTYGRSAYFNESFQNLLHAPFSKFSH